mgnify:CR=1 FL=1
MTPTNTTIPTARALRATRCSARAATGAAVLVR